MQSPSVRPTSPGPVAATRAAATALLVALALPLTACPGPYQFRQMREDLDGLKRETVAIKAMAKRGDNELALRQALADMGASLDQIRNDFSLLQGRLESLQEQAGRRSDEQLKVRQELEIRIAQIADEMESLRKRLDAATGNVGPIGGPFVAPPGPYPAPTGSPGGAAPGASPEPTGTPLGKLVPPGPVVPPTPHPTRPGMILPAKGSETDQQLYQRATHTFDAKQFADARTLYGELINRFPKSEFADNARYWIAESYYVEKDFASAILEFDKVAHDYPQGDKVPAALLKQGFAFLEIGEKDGGIATLQDLIKRYPKSDEAKKAKERLSKVK